LITWIQTISFNRRSGSIRMDAFRAKAKNWNAFFVPQPLKRSSLFIVFGHVFFPQWWRIGVHSSLVTTRLSPELVWTLCLDLGQSIGS